jgi:uncharacterized protein (DUF302 family)
METYRFEVERIDVASTKSFSELVATLEQQVPPVEISVFSQMIASRFNAQEIERAVDGMVGDLGFLIVGKLDQGPLVSLLGKPKKMTGYLLGNPILANRMYELRPEVGLYAPLRAFVYEDYGGVSHLSYDRPSSLLRQFDNEEITSVARILDDRMSKLAERVTGND